MLPTTGRHRLKPVAALRRVNAKLSLRDELDAMALLPPTQRRSVTVPALDREQLTSLRTELPGTLGEIEGRAARVGLGVSSVLPDSRDTPRGKRRDAEAP